MLERTVRMQRLIGSVAALAIAAGAAVARATDTPAALAQTFRSATEGIAVRYPAGWVLARGVTTVVTNPALCFALVPMAGANVDVQVVEYLPPLLSPGGLSGYQPRPHRFQLAKLRKSDADWTTGKILSFRDHGRVFYVGVVRPASSTRSLGQTIQAILDSLQIKSKGRCGPPARR